ncbi:hypothetical protein HU200_050770 [Digitaria exilis]|uniref:Uncharacterized protein n=1 Tax=Digitaria exilis TaxID=1010633 RepID=A0A835E5L3_9POAL|nr:hypothetical protein HU200_050770 [Digitaria exilis]
MLACIACSSKEGGEDGSRAPATPHGKDAVKSLTSQNKRGTEERRPSSDTSYARHYIPARARTSRASNKATARLAAVSSRAIAPLPSVRSLAAAFCTHPTWLPPAFTAKLPQDAINWTPTTYSHHRSIRFRSDHTQLAQRRRLPRSPLTYASSFSPVHVVVSLQLNHTQRALVLVQSCQPSKLPAMSSDGMHAMPQPARPRPLDSDQSFIDPTLAGRLKHAGTTCSITALLGEQKPVKGSPPTRFILFARKEKGRAGLAMLLPLLELRITPRLPLFLVESHAAAAGPGGNLGITLPAAASDPTGQASLPLAAFPDAHATHKTACIAAARVVARWLARSPRRGGRGGRRHMLRRGCHYGGEVRLL